MEPHDNPHLKSLREVGRSPETGKPIASERRLFMQLQVYTGCTDVPALVDWLSASDLDGVLYRDFHDPRGVGFLSATEDPEDIPGRIRDTLLDSPFRTLQPRPGYTMTGRTYAIGYETDLDRVLVDRPLERVSNPDWPWAVWYPLKRKPFFYRLPAEVQRDVLMEHGEIGQAFGAAGVAHDIRLACFGLDAADNDFLVGLVGPTLHPLSAVVQTMRKTRQTARYIERMGPFFTGRVAWQRNRSAAV